MKKMTIGVKSWNQIGDTLILGAACANVREIALQRGLDIRWAYRGPERLWPLLHGLDGWLDYGAHTEVEVWKEVRYGMGESEAARGSYIEAATLTLLEYLGMPSPSTGGDSDGIPFFSHLTPLEPYIPEGDRLWGRETISSVPCTDPYGEKRPVVLVNANSQLGCSETKAYPYWKQVVGGLEDWYRVFQVGGKEDRDVSTDLPVDPAQDLRGRTTLTQLLALAREADVVVSAPGGLTHMAAIWGRPSVCVAGERENPKCYRTYQDNVWIASPRGSDSNGAKRHSMVRACGERPCGRKYCRAYTGLECGRWISDGGGDGHPECMEIPPEAIIDVISILAPSL